MKNLICDDKIMKSKLIEIFNERPLIKTLINNGLIIVTCKITQADMLIIHFESKYNFYSRVNIDLRSYAMSNYNKEYLWNEIYIPLENVINHEI